MLLDIIVPHYNESWDEVSKLFEILALQRGVDFSSFRVLLVNDGDDHEILPYIYARKYPYEVVGLTISHGGVSAARNRGLEYSKAEWIMFCDCDDTYTSIFSLKSIMDVLDTKDYDLLWTPFFIETDAKGTVIKREPFNNIFIHGKVFRRSYLIDHELRFNTDLTYAEDTAFCTVLLMILPFERVGEIKSGFIPYLWTFRKGSATTNPARAVENAVGLFRKNAYVADKFREYGKDKQGAEMAFRAMCDAYVVRHRTDIEVDKSFDEEVEHFYSRWLDCENLVDDETKEKAMKGAVNEANTDEKNIQPPISEFPTYLKDFKKTMIRR